MLTPGGPLLWRDPEQEIWVLSIILCTVLTVTDSSVHKKQISPKNKFN